MDLDGVASRKRAAPHAIWVGDWGFSRKKEKKEKDGTLCGFFWLARSQLHGFCLVPNGWWWFFFQVKWLYGHSRIL